MIATTLIRKGAGMMLTLPTNARRCILITAVAVLASACIDAGRSMTPDKDNATFRQPHFAVQVDTAVPADYVAGSRRQEEQAAIAALIERTPAVHRQALQLLLDKPNSDWIGSDDAESARLLGIIASIRYADSLALRATRATQPDLASAINLVRVTVILVPTLGSTEARATVIRSPNDSGRPLLLLRESDATPADLAAGLRAAATYAAHGTAPSREVRVDVRQTTSGQATGARAEANVRQLAMVRAARVRDIPGFGKVRSMDFMTEVRSR